LKQIDRVAGVVPEQMVRPAARLAEQIQIRAAKEKCLHDQLLYFQFTCLNPVTDPLVTWIESARVTDHRNLAGFLLHINDTSGISKRVRHRYFNHDMLSGTHDLFRLICMDLSRTRQDGRLDIGLSQALCKVSGSVRYASFLGNGLCRVRAAPGNSRYFDANYSRKRVQMFVCESALSNHANFHFSLLVNFRE
jgi:hypothetical protein